MKVVLLTTDARECYRQYDLPEPYFGTAPQALMQGFAQLPEVELHVVSCWQRPLGGRKELAGNIRFHGLEVPRLGWLRTAYQGCIRAVRRRLREIQPDIVHGQGTERDCAISAVFSGFPNVLTLHGNMRLIARVNKARPFSFHWLAARIETFTIPRSHGIVCITRYTQEAVRGLARRTWVVPNAVDESFFSLQTVLKEPPTIVCVGDIGLRKNQNAFIQALDSLARGLSFRVLFLGNANPKDPYAVEFLKLVEARTWCDYGRFADREKMKVHFREATMLALPSVEDNCPMVVLEAMAAGVPVLAARVGGVPELVSEGVNGLLCDPHDPASIRQGVQRLLTDANLRRELTARAREQAFQRYHAQVIARRHLEIYREVLSTRS